MDQLMMFEDLESKVEATGGIPRLPLAGTSL
jgi:hypothetical protein